LGPNPPKEEGGGDNSNYTHFFVQRNIYEWSSAAKLIILQTFTICNQLLTKLGRRRPKEEQLWNAMFAGLALTR
jgi:hypothetical protein